MKRYKKLVLNGNEGITFEVSEGTGGELIINAIPKADYGSISDVYSALPAVSAGEYAEVLSVYTDKDGNKAVVPPGWTVSKVSSENTIWGKNLGLVIYHIPEKRVRNIDWTRPNEVQTLQRKYDQFVCTPVSLLSPNGTMDGISFKEKFGRRNYKNEKFSEFHEELSGDLVLEKQSIDKYGVFYSSRYDISRDRITGMPRSICGSYPWTNIDPASAIEVASTMISTSILTSHLMYGAEYDTRFEWIINTRTMTPYAIAEDSTEWGNYRNTSNSQGRLAKTGSSEKWCINTIYDLTGNVTELTQEQFGSSHYQVIRGGAYNLIGSGYPATYRFSQYSSDDYAHTGFRTTICIK